MRTTLLSAAFALLAFCFLALSSSAQETCPKENCIPPEHCQIPMKGENFICTEEGTKCCSVVKDEFRTHCRHYGGECMDRCSPNLTREVVDCPNQLCCVLV